MQLTCRTIAGWALVASLGLAVPVEGWSQGRPPPAVSVSPVIQGDVATEQTFVGTVEPVRTSTVGSAVDGRIGEFLVREGDRVAKGQVLARLLSEQVEIQLEAAKAELALRQAALDELKNGLRPEEIEQAKARSLATEAAWQYAKSLLERNERLAGQGAVTADELQEASTGAQQAYQAHLEARAAWDLARLGARAEKIAQAQASVNVQKQEVRALEDQLRKHSIVSPFDGFVVEQFVEVGQWVTQSGDVVTVVELAEVEVEAPVPETYLPAIRVGASAMVHVPTLGDERFAGQVSAIVRRADPISRTFPVKVRLQNHIDGNEVLFNPGMQARIKLYVGRTARATLVPKDAVSLGGQQPVVFVVRTAAGGKQTVVESVEIKLGAASGGMIAIEGQVAPGDRVVVQGNERLKPGEAVRVVEVTPTATYRPPTVAAEQSSAAQP